MFLRKTWAWWSLAALHVFNAVLHAKLATPLGNINWDHERAWQAAAPYLIVNGVPFAVSLVVLVCLMPTGIRLTYGVKQRELARRRPVRSRSR